MGARAAAAFVVLWIMCAGAMFAGLDARGAAAPAAAPATDEVRALWVLRSSLTTPTQIATLVQRARDHGFNTLLVQVRGRGDAYFRGGAEPVAAELLRQPATFDPLAVVVRSGHAAGLRVHAWVNVNLISSAADLPASRDHLIYRHPEWLMVPRDIAQELAKIEPGSPAYVGKLARWTRGQASGVEGLYASPILGVSAAYTEALVRDLARRYDVDGVHFDYARYPSDRFDYSVAAIRQFRTTIRGTLADAARKEIDARETVDLFAYPDALPDQWRAFRVGRMTALMQRLSAAVRAERPNAEVTAATAPDAREALQFRLQDWAAWLRGDLIDAICPMAYTVEPARFAEQIGAVRGIAGPHGVWAGIGAYRLSPAETLDNIQTARRLGAAGVILFSYDSLVDPRQAIPDYLSIIGRGAFTPPGFPVAGPR